MKSIETYIFLVTEETYNKWPEWQKVYIDIDSPGAIYMYKSMKKYYKIRL